MKLKKKNNLSLDTFINFSLYDKKFGYYILKSLNRKKNIKLINYAYKDAKQKFNPLKMSKLYRNLVKK